MKPRFGHKNNVMLPALTEINPRDSVQWTWPLTFRHMDQQWLALLAPWGQGLEAGLQCIPGVTAEWPPKITVVYPKHLGRKSILQGSFVLSFWSVHVPPMALYIDPSVTPTGRGVKVWYTRPGRDSIPATVLSQDHSAHILPDGQDLPMLVSLKYVSYCP